MARQAPYLGWAGAGPRRWQTLRQQLQGGPSGGSGQAVQGERARAASFGSQWRPRYPFATMPAPVPPLSSVLQLLSKASVSPGVRRTAKGNEGAGPVQQARRAGEGKSPAERLHARLRVARLQPGWSASKALRLLVEAALLQEFGDALQLDPSFGELVERTCGAIEQDEGCAALLQEAFEQMSLLGEVPPAR